MAEKEDDVNHRPYESNRVAILKAKCNASGLITFYPVAWQFLSEFPDINLAPKTPSLDDRISSLQQVEKRIMSNIGHLSLIGPPS